MSADVYGSFFRLAGGRSGLDGGCGEPFLTAQTVKPTRHPLSRVGRYSVAIAQRRYEWPAGNGYTR